MTLSEVVGKLATEKDGKLEANSYNAKLIYQTQKGINELGTYDFSTKKGLEEYANSTGDNISKLSRAQSEEVRNLRGKQAESYLTTHLTKHFDKLLGELPEETQIATAFQYCPEQDTKDKKYNTARRQVSNTNEQLKKMEDTKKYIEEILPGLDKSFKSYIIRYSDTFMKISQQEAIEVGKQAITDYGISKFLTTTSKHYDSELKAIKDSEEKNSKSNGRKNNCIQKTKRKNAFCNRTS